MRQTVDTSDISQAIVADVETEYKRKRLRLRPHSPATYYPAQGYAIVIDFEDLDNLIALAERNGYKRL